MGKPVRQFQIISSSPEETAQFYSNLFGWTVNSDNPLGYREINTGSAEGIQGGIWPAPRQAPNFVQLFTAVHDVRACVKRAQQMGAQLIIPPTALPDGGELAVMHDPQGMSFGVMKAS
jgi:predicted enzyme related to lactoylglutathione lyase